MFSQTRTRSPAKCVSWGPTEQVSDCVLLTVPVGDVLVGNAGGDIEHDDTALAVDVVTITETTKLLLAGGIPDVELDLTKVLFSMR